MKQVVLFFEIKFTTVVKITFRKRGQMRSIVERGRQIHEQTQKTHVHVHVSTNFRTYSANVTKN